MIPVVITINNRRLADWLGVRPPHEVTGPAFLVSLHDEDFLWPIDPKLLHELMTGKERGRP